MTEDEMVGWHHQLNGHEFGQAPGVGVGQGGLECCNSWGCKESYMTEGGTELKLINMVLGHCIVSDEWKLYPKEKG